jgi:diguanylate cyclase (GGDEF)-like protein/PAS domain S-box-containing protein
VRVQQRKDAEALRQSQAFLERTGKVAGIGGWEVDLLTRKQTWSVQTRQIIGLATELSLEEGLKLYPPEARPIMNAAFERAASTGEGFDLELPFVCSDGSRIWVRAVGGAELRDGKPVRVVGAFQDVTVRVAERQALQTSNERFTLATASGGIGIYEWDVGSGELIWDAQMHRLYGLDPSEAVPDMEQWRRFVHPEDLAALEQAAHDAIAADTPFQREFRIIWRDGSEHVLKASGHVERAADDQALRFVGANWDITQARRLAADIEEQRNLLHVTLASINDAVITTDAFGNIRWLNPVAELMTGYSLADAQTRPAEAILNIVHEVTREPLGSAIASCLARKTMERTELGILISRSGNEFAIEESASPIRNARGELLGVVLVFHDVTKLRRLSSEASYRAAHDALTGLPNRAALLDLMQHSVNEAKRDGSIFAILFVDLDHFKLYNDSFGHATGDRILKVAGTRLQRSLRHHDVVARLGGDEFVIIYRELLNATDAERLANKLIATLAEPIVIQNAPEIRITASVGVAVFPNDGRDAETLLHNADLAMYRAKGHGRNGVAHYLASAALNTHDSIHEARRVTKGLAGNEFVAYYQPIIDLQSGRVATMEALARWMHPTRGLILPERFIPVAERSGTIFKLGRSILRQACIRASQWIGIYGPQAPRVSVNVSPSQFRDEDFLGIISEALAESGLPSDRLQLEVTESLLIEDEAHTIAMLHALADSGVTIAIDDFGTGYSSLSYLTRLPVDVIKIDKSFITGLTTVPERSAIVRAIIAMSRSLRMGVVAEGVEDYAPASFLRDEGCTGIQGFVIQRALSGSDAVAFIESFDGRGFIRKIAAR